MVANLTFTSPFLNEWNFKKECVSIMKKIKKFFNSIRTLVVEKIRMVVENIRMLVIFIFTDTFTNTITTATSIVSLIPNMRFCKIPKIITLYYDRIKEIAFYTTDETTFGILIINFIDHPSINPKKDNDVGNFILRRYIITIDSYNRLLMLGKYINEFTDPNLICFYEEALRSLKPA